LSIHEAEDPHSLIVAITMDDEIDLDSSDLGNLHVQLGPREARSLVGALLKLRYQDWCSGVWSRTLAWNAARILRKEAIKNG
jgi:hypothetical protein